MAIPLSLKVAIKKYFPKPVYAGLNFLHPERKFRNKLFNKFDINLVFDIGANIGLYAHAIRHTGYNHKIISFEPIRQPYDILCHLSEKDENWSAVNIGLGDTDTECDINVSGNSVSSSILEMKSYHSDLVPESRFTGKERIIVKKLDSIFNNYYKSGDRVFCKIDTQGYEKKILEGASESMKNILGFQLELSIKPMYEKELNYFEMFKFMKDLGFELYGLEPGWYDFKNGNMVQFDAIFFRE